MCRRKTKVIQRINLTNEWNLQGKWKIEKRLRIIIKWYKINRKINFRKKYPSNIEFIRDKR